MQMEQFFFMTLALAVGSAFGQVRLSVMNPGNNDTYILACRDNSFFDIANSRYFANISNALVSVDSFGTISSSGRLRFNLTQDREGFYFCRDPNNVQSNTLTLLGKLVSIARVLFTMLHMHA